ncbi:MAG: hypothetical protein M1812_000581 [Candelaria pacifica]|nr:MAG: hypothetical protein M1812_000581 [Candelaria pacifica]
MVKADEMANLEDPEIATSKRNFAGPYTAHHPVPTVQGYREGIHSNSEGEGRLQQAVDSAKNYWYSDNGDTSHDSAQDSFPQSYSGENRNSTNNVGQEARDSNRGSHEANGQEPLPKTQDDHDRAQSMATETDPRQKRKNMKHMKRDHDQREVTDPVTHLPVTIHDSTNAELEHIPGNLPAVGSEPRTLTGVGAMKKSRTQLDKETQEGQAAHSGMESMFPPPRFETTRRELAQLYRLTLSVGLGAILVVAMLVLMISPLSGKLFASILGLCLGLPLIWGLRSWVEKKVDQIWQDEVWSAKGEQRKQEVASSSAPESTHWLNSLLASVWPLVNPDLFTSLADTLEDVMQASLPKMVRMISVEDLGQGSEAIQILGVRWLPTGAAARSVSIDGRLKSNNEKGNSDRKTPGEGEIEKDAKAEQSDKHDENGKEDSKQEGDEENIAEGMEAEEGDFVNVEIAFAYRAKSSGKDLRTKAKNAHLYLAFYLPGSMRFPVWVELRGIVGTMRLRLQLTPDPPFFALCTLTLLGQPKVDLSCVPLTKKGLNIMDLPIISGFVQSSVDAAMAEYVAPKSLTLDLKDMLIGDDFKKDTVARGIVVVQIKKASHFKEGDPSLGGLKKGSSDAYVAVGWAKFGKAVWSTRVIVGDMEPIWDETAFLTIGPDELNADERLQIKIWDSDRFTADDDLGQVEVDLKEIMSSPESKGRMHDRHDDFAAAKANEKMPGSIEWSVGYFAKTKLLPSQLARQTEDPDIRNRRDLEDKVSKEAEGKLREATDRDESHEIEQQKAQSLKQRQDAMIICAPPSEDYPSGILSIQIHQVVGLEYERQNKNKGKNDADNDEEEEAGGDLPSSYCTVILNHQKIFKTRTKPKNAKPFFNAGTERFIRDWRNTEIMLSIRDSRVHEDDPLLGIVVLPLGEVFNKRSQVNDYYPLVGGIGYGRARVSMVFRSVQLKVPKALLGWEYGTLEVTSPIKSNDLSQEYLSYRLKIRTTVGKGKMSRSNDGWKGKKDRPVRIAVRKRYSSCVVVEFRKNSLGFDKTPAYAVCWLKDLPDDEEKTVNLPVWKGDAEGLKRAESSCDSELGEKIGHIEVPLRFWPGLSGYHKKLAHNDPNLTDVMEILDTANDNKESQDAFDSGDDDNSSDSEDEHKSPIAKLRSAGSEGKADHDLQASGRRGPLDQIRDYRDHSSELHRKHRGLMQWKGARTIKWVKTKIEHGSDHVSNQFKHQSERDPGIETEV